MFGWNSNQGKARLSSLEEFLLVIEIPETGPLGGQEGRHWLSYLVNSGMLEEKEVRVDRHRCYLVTPRGMELLRVVMELAEALKPDSGPETN